MKRMQTGRWMPAALLLAVCGAVSGWAQGPTIQSFDGTGRLTFNEVSTAEKYRLEWAPSPAGPWTNFTGAAGAELDLIVAKGSGIVTCAVPMCYRVVAVPAKVYLVVDLSGGPAAASYLVTYLDAVPPGGWTDEYKTTKLVLRRIPAGSFTMGSPTDELGRGGDETQHQVTITQPFYVGVFEVTQRQWELVMGNKPSFFDNATYYQTRPVEQVSYCDVRENPANSDDPAVNWPANHAVNADSFMGKLRAKTGLSGFDLPTEAQWEYAGRAGTTTALNSGYNLTGTDQDARMDEVGRYWYNGGQWYMQWDCPPSAGTAAAGTYPANAWGLYDMHGNVWEWCLDWYGTYPGTVTDPPGASSGSYRVARGGSYWHEANVCRSAFRGHFYTEFRSFIYGFRACCAPQVSRELRQAKEGAWRAATVRAVPRGTRG